MPRPGLRRLGRRAPRLVAVDAVPGAAFVEALRAAWDRGDAVLPVDPRFPPPARDAVLTALRPGDPVEPGDALVVATGGTTGEPRGVVLTTAAVEAAVIAVSRRLAVDPAADAWLACLPLAHVGGLFVVLRALLTGTPLTFDAGARATLTSVVPTMLPRVDAGSFRRLLVGGAAPHGRLPPNATVTWGLTETAGGVVHDGVPLDGVEVRTGARGELLVRGPMLLRCYRDGSDPKDSEGWLPTGDAGRVEDGRVRVDGRLSDLVVTGGENVWPEPVEEALRAHPGVGDAAVVGRPDPEWGERVVAVVVPAHPSAPPALDELRALVKERLPAYAAPRELVLVDRLPRTPLGKLRRADLRSRPTPASPPARSRSPR